MVAATRTRRCSTAPQSALTGLTGAHLVRASRRAKLTVATFSDGTTLVVSYRMTGKLVRADLPSPRRRRIRLRLAVADRPEVWFDDTRRLGRVHVVRTSHLAEWLEERDLGPDPPSAGRPRGGANTSDRAAGPSSRCSSTRPGSPGSETSAPASPCGAPGSTPAPAPATSKPTTGAPSRPPYRPGSAHPPKRDEARDRFRHPRRAKTLLDLRPPGWVLPPLQPLEAFKQGGRTTFWCSACVTQGRRGSRRASDSPWPAPPSSRGSRWASPSWSSGPRINRRARRRPERASLAAADAPPVTLQTTPAPRARTSHPRSTATRTGWTRTSAPPRRSGAPRPKRRISTPTRRSRARRRQPCARCPRRLPRHRPRSPRCRSWCPSSPPSCRSGWRSQLLSMALNPSNRIWLCALSDKKVWSGGLTVPVSDADP